MDWWGWLIVVLVVLAVIGAAFAYVQTKRRSSGVIIAGKRPGSTKR